MGIASLLGLLIGFSTFGLREDYLAIVTFGVSELIRLVANNEEWLTKGSYGVYGYPLPLDFNPSLFSEVVMILLFTLIAVGAGMAAFAIFKVPMARKSGNSREKLSTLQARNCNPHGGDRTSNHC